MDGYQKVVVTLLLTALTLSVSLLVYFGKSEQWKHETCYQHFYYNEAHRVLVPNENYCGKNAVSLKEREEK